MNIITALQVVRDLSAPFDKFIGALEVLSMYRDGAFVVNYCHILDSNIYIQLDAQTLRYLDLLAG